jgi:hypothetical protein
MSNKESETKHSLSPSELLKRRKPELFSDSYTASEPQLTKEVLEFHIDSVTSRNEDQKFEHFARRLLEKEVCPNLLPQTGPTGGGDSKVDTETYPVSADIAVRWYGGVDQSAAQERWGFAISAKKAWRPKVKSDVKKIIETGRGYKRVFYVSNQAIAAKKRAEVEDQLTSLYGIPIRIFDRNWIVEKVIQNDHRQIAIDTLGLSVVEERGRVVGPNDTGREIELSELDKQIADPSRYLGVEYQLAEDCLDAAILARNLERPRAEIDGRFAAALRVANKAGVERQLLRIKFEMAWSAFWYFEDYAELDRQYEEVAALALKSEQSDDLERLSSLWTVLNIAVAQGGLEKNAARLDFRLAALKGALAPLIENKSRPTNSARATAILHLAELVDAHWHNGNPDSALLGLKQVVATSGGLLNFPLEKLFQVVQEIGGALVNNRIFDELFEQLAEAIATRRGEGEAGEALLQRGIQKLRADLPYEAIRFFGRAQEKLAKREYRGRLAAATLLCSGAYDMAGLPWAARSSALFAANLEFDEFVERGALTRTGLRAVEKLVWLELRLARVADVLAWIELEDVVLEHLAAANALDERLLESRRTQDYVLAILLLSSEQAQLEQLRLMPDLLEQLSLPASAMAAIFTLGHEDALVTDGWIPDSESTEDTQKIFEAMYSQPIRHQLPSQPDLAVGPRIVLRSRVLGCEVSLDCPNELESVHLAESILGGLEAFLATSLKSEAFPFRRSLNLRIDSVVEPHEVPVFELCEQGDVDIRIRHCKAPVEQSRETQSKYCDWLLQLVMTIVQRLTVIRDFNSYMDKIAGEERAISRAFSYAHVPIFIHNILGESPKLRIADWTHGRELRDWEVKRRWPWKNEPEVKSLKVLKLEEERESAATDAEPPPEFFNLERGKHSDRRVESLIDVPTWDKARWSGTALMRIEGAVAPPLMAFLFRDKLAGRRIFEDWQKQFGQLDAAGRLRISVLKGVDTRHPEHYRILVGTNVSEAAAAGKLIVTTARIQTMQPSTRANLDAFVDEVKKGGRFLIAPAYFPAGASEPEIQYDLCIGKENLVVRELWEVGQNDEDFMAVQADDMPIIPPDIANPPVLGVIERKRSCEKQPSE